MAPPTPAKSKGVQIVYDGFDDLFHDPDVQWNTVVFRARIELPITERKEHPQENPYCKEAEFALKQATVLFMRDLPGANHRCTESMMPNWKLKTVFSYPSGRPERNSYRYATINARFAMHSTLGDRIEALAGDNILFLPWGEGAAYEHVEVYWEKRPVAKVYEIRGLPDDTSVAQARRLFEQQDIKIQSLHPSQRTADPTLDDLPVDGLTLIIEPTSVEPPQHMTIISSKDSSKVLHVKCTRATHIPVIAAPSTPPPPSRTGKSYANVIRTRFPMRHTPQPSESSGEADPTQGSSPAATSSATISTDQDVSYDPGAFEHPDDMSD